MLDILCSLTEQVHENDLQALLEVVLGAGAGYTPSNICWYKMTFYTVFISDGLSEKPLHTGCMSLLD